MSLRREMGFMGVPLRAQCTLRLWEGAAGDHRLACELLNPASATMVTWTTRNSRRNPETKKCSVRADCRPPSKSTAAGTAESKAGDKARPSPDHQRKQDEDHRQIGDALHYVIGAGFRFIGRRAAKGLRNHSPESAPRSIRRHRKEVSRGSGRSKDLQPRRPGRSTPRPMRTENGETGSSRSGPACT